MRANIAIGKHVKPLAKPVPATRKKVAGDAQGLVPIILQRLSKGDRAPPDGRVETNGAEVTGVEAGQHTRQARQCPGGRRDSTRERQPTACQLVETRRGFALVPRESKMIGPERIDRHQQDVRSRLHVVILHSGSDDHNSQCNQPGQQEHEREADSPCRPKGTPDQQVQTTHGGDPTNVATKCFSSNWVGTRD